MPKRPSPTARPTGADQDRFAQAAACLRAGDWQGAERLCRGLSGRHEGHPALSELQGMILLGKGEGEAAADRFKDAIAAGLRTAAVHNNLALALNAAGDLEGAVEASETAVRLEPAVAAFQANLGNRLRALGRIDEAKAAYGRAIAAEPAFASAHVGLGNAHAALGERGEAVACYRRALELRPGDARAFYHLALTAKAGEDGVDKALIESFRKRIETDGLGRGDAALVHNALGVVADRAGDWDRAFGHFEQFNAAARAECDARGQVYDRRQHSRRVDRVIESYPAVRFATETISGSSSRRPLFIVGMARSGTTLVEQILGSHRAVAAGGELPAIDEIAQGASGGASGGGARDMTDDGIAGQGARYLRLLERIDPTAERVTDKLPRNFLHLGLIARLFPGAAVVHCRRHPMDTCLSCYFQNFQQANDYAYDLEDLGAYYRDYDRLMAHWKEVLPVAPVEVGYEALVRDPEREVRRLLDRLGLDWDRGCLDFARSRRPVLTASQWQVRETIHTGSIGRWRHYRAHLDPLREALGDLAA